MKILTALFLLISSVSLGADYYWVGNTGNWSDITKWANSSGGAGGGYVSLPTNSDNVFFDANSFATGGDTVFIDVDAFAANLDFTGVTNSPVVDGSSAITIEVGNTLTFEASIIHDFEGNYVFTSSAAVTIISATKTFNGNILFNGVGGVFTLSEDLVVLGEIGLENGIFDMAGFSVTANNLNANYGTNSRTIDFGGSAVTLTGDGTALDLRGNTTNLSVIAGATTITLTNGNDIEVECGNIAKTLPNLTFSNSDQDIDINTGNVENNTERITFGHIIVSQAGADFTVDGNNDDSNIKTFESITLPNNCRYIIGSGDGTGGFAGTNHTIVNSDFIVGNNGNGDVRGDFIEILGNYDAGTGSDCNFLRRVRFASDFIVDGTGGNNIILGNNTEFSNDILINGTSTFRVRRDTDISGDIIVAADADVNINNFGTVAVTTVLGTVTLGDDATIDFGGGVPGIFDIADISMATKTQLDINNSTSITTIGNLTLNPFCIVRFNTNASTDITGTLTAAGSCDVWVWLKSITDGQQATVAFTSPQTVSYNIFQDLNSSTSNIENSNGVDLSNNAGSITFPASTSPTTFYWVGSTTGNTKTGTNSSGVNDNWSNPDNWSTVSGNYSGTNSCIPGAQDDVVFNASSFSAGAGNVDVDLFIQACNDITFSGLPAGCTMDAGLTTTDRSLIIYGNTSLHNNLDNQFEGDITFSANDGTTRTITSDGSNFFGNVNFDFIGGNWSIVDDFDMNGEENADVLFANGTVNANAVQWTIEDDWTVANGTFTASTSTVIFDGPASQNSSQLVISNGNPFYNFHVNRETNGGGANDRVQTNDELTVNNDLIISVGALFDNGLQITGSVSGQMSISDGARIILGRSNFSTLFPTNYIAANITLSQISEVRYNSNITQTISSLPDYGRLYLTNAAANPNFANKTLDGAITVNDRLLVTSYNNLVDAGFQITGNAGEEIQINANAQLTLGSATTATQFPLNFTIIDINAPSTVVYNAGINQSIKSITGLNDARYSNITLTNAAGAGTPIKTLEGDIIVRGNLTINANNELDVDITNDFEVELQGNWDNDGNFIPQEGTVNLTGTSTQTITSGGTEETFYNLIAANSSGGGIVLEDDISISNLLTFTNGIIYEGSGTNELVTIEDGATVTGASDASHVDGRIEKIGSIAFDFPVGKNNLYRPISIGIPTVAASGFRAEYFQLNPDPTFDETSLDPSIDHISNCEYWILDRTTPSGDATVTLSWASTSCTVTDMADLVVARWDGAVWRDEGTDGSPTGTNANGTVTTSANVTSFSPFTLASISTNNPLPIQLISFEAYLDHNNVILEWLTASEINNDFFTIERSKNGQDWESIITRDGAGNSLTEINYLETDFRPYAGISYYRLKQTDFNGLFSYSQTVTINRDSGDEFLIYPNPIEQGNPINLILSKEIMGKDFQITISDMLGKMVFYRPVEGNYTKNNMTIYPEHKLEMGTYTLSISNENKSYHQTYVIR